MLQQYNGELGNFKYNDDEFCIQYSLNIDGSIGEDLIYIGDDNGENIVIPDGINALRKTFKDCKFLTTVPSIPDSVKEYNNVFEGCRKDIEEAGELLLNKIVDKEEDIELDI